MDADNNFLATELWQKIQRSVPIACVDFVPYRLLSDGSVLIGFILRETPDQGQRWSIAGGRLRLDETVGEALVREIESAFVGGLSLVGEAIHPPLVVEFLREKRPGFPVDLRQHALSLTHVLEVSDEEPQVRGAEVLDFRWFTFAEIIAAPATLLLGFGQEVLLDRFAVEITRQQG
ncbi:MAG: NUDIX hydrolase [Microbacteriaceae bacterium]